MRSADQTTSSANFVPGSSARIRPKGGIGIRRYDPFRMRATNADILGVEFRQGHARISANSLVNFMGET